MSKDNKLRAERLNKDAVSESWNRSSDLVKVLISQHFHKSLLMQKYWSIINLMYLKYQKQKYSVQ